MRTEGPATVPSSPPPDFHTTNLDPSLNGGREAALSMRPKGKQDGHATPGTCCAGLASPRKNAPDDEKLRAPDPISQALRAEQE